MMLYIACALTLWCESLCASIASNAIKILDPMVHTSLKSIEKSYKTDRRFSLEISRKKILANNVYNVHVCGESGFSFKDLFNHLVAIILCKPQKHAMPFDAFKNNVYEKLEIFAQDENVLKITFST